MEEEEKKKQIRYKGLRKVALGVVSLIPVTSVVGGIIFSLGVNASIGGLVLRGVGWMTGSKTLSNAGKNLMSMGIKAMTTGGVMAIPFAGGAALITEGAYNVTTGKQPSIYGYEIGVEPMARKVARFVSGLPQFGDPDYEHSITGWQNSTPSTPEHNPQHQQQQQYVSRVYTPSNNGAKQQSLSPHQVQSYASPVEKLEPASIEHVAKQATYKDASKAYLDQASKPNVIKFEVHEIQKVDESIVVTYKPPGWKKGDSGDLLVTQTFNKDLELIKVDARKASCVTPPVKQEDGSFTIHSHDKGVAKNIKENLAYINNIRDSVIRSESSIGSTFSSINRPRASSMSSRSSQL